MIIIMITIISIKKYDWQSGYEYYEEKSGECVVL